MPTGLRKSRPGAAYRWIKPSTDAWKLVLALTERLEQEGAYPFKMKSNRVATMIFEEAVKNLPSDWKPEL